MGNDPHRARVVAGESAKVSELRQQWRDTTVGENERDFAQFVTRRALLALERAEYRILGPQYKSPRLMKPEILASKRFRAGVEKIQDATVDEAGEMLDELATGWSRASVDLVSVLGRSLSRGFDPEIDYDEFQVAAMRTGLEVHPAVLLFSHRSYIDGAVVPVAMQENRLPPVHVFAGINLSFGLMGPLLRRSGVIFIRRDIGGNPLYKYVLREYVGYIVEKRFKDLYEGKAAALKEYQQAQGQLVGAQNDMRSAEMSLEAARVRLGIVGFTDDEVAALKEKGTVRRATPICKPKIPCE